MRPSKALSFTTFSLFFALIHQANTSPIDYGTCQTDCNIVAVKCYTAAGYTFGTVTTPLAPPAIIACNNALGNCSSACAAATLTPTP